MHPERSHTPTCFGAPSFWFCLAVGRIEFSTFITTAICVCGMSRCKTYTGHCLDRDNTRRQKKRKHYHVKQRGLLHSAIRASARRECTTMAFSGSIPMRLHALHASDRSSSVAAFLRACDGDARRIRAQHSTAVLSWRREERPILKQS